ncbi:PilZ domain-containing protein [Deferribacterales bacterium Es71-Z0220]|jgi:hypothetical protein|uniref:PilZ domain-containing protein n=1 Tax=Deferrivibrio essentukiensis TaxID=2880922 RepID=UPI001F61D05F|nr:PilZ domain-containing protein [Deferrivibrio essentukiensis]MBZ4672146.1 hypothetical protein [Deferribacteraceae bacterium]MCB4204956.1 PilZ domain-containing protein [Deferrivibrio essentukiensis]
MNLGDYNTFGCSVYVLPAGKTLYGFWLEEKRTGNSELLYVTAERFYRVTHIDLKKETNFILQCTKCENIKCRYNPGYKNHKRVKYQPIIERESIFEKRTQPRVNIMLKAKVLMISDIGIDGDWEDYHSAKIVNISTKGCCLEFEGNFEDIMPDVHDNIEIAFENDIYVRQPDDKNNVTVFRLSKISPIIGEVMWRMQNRCGIQFLIAKSSDIKVIADFIEEIAMVKSKI